MNELKHEIEDKKIWIYDIETILNCFTLTALNKDTEEIKKFVLWIYDFEVIDQTEELYYFLTRECKGMVGFNNISFDYIVVEKFLDIYKEYRNNVSRIIANLYMCSQEIIQEQKNQFFPTSIPTWKQKIKQLDLMKVFHYDNKNKRVSLKQLEFEMKFPNIDEMPLKHYEEIKSKEGVKLILDYNLNDVKATFELYKIARGNTILPFYKGKDKIVFRNTIKQEYNIDCINYNDVKIGDELNKKAYLKNAGIDYQQLKDLHKTVKPFTFEQCIPDYIVFSTKELNDFYEKIKKEKINLEKKQEFPLIFRGTKYMIAKGGIHSEDRARKIFPSSNEILRDADVGGQYPNAIIKRRLFPKHLGEEWLIGYKQTAENKAIAKIKYKETQDVKYKTIEESAKLSANGGGLKLN